LRVNNKKGGNAQRGPGQGVMRFPYKKGGNGLKDGPEGTLEKKVIGGTYWGLKEKQRGEVLI